MSFASAKYGSTWRASCNAQGGESPDLPGSIGGPCPFQQPARWDGSIAGLGTRETGQGHQDRVAALTRRVQLGDSIGRDAMLAVKGLQFPFEILQGLSGASGSPHMERGVGGKHADHVAAATLFGVLNELPGGGGDFFTRSGDERRGEIHRDRADQTRNWNAQELLIIALNGKPDAAACQQQQDDHQRPWILQDVTGDQIVGEDEVGEGHVSSCFDSSGYRAAPFSGRCFTTTGYAGSKEDAEWLR